MEELPHETNLSLRVALVIDELYLYPLEMEYVLMLVVPLMLFTWYWLIFRKEK